jgi:Tannase and feruloyl esterase
LDFSGGTPGIIKLNTTNGTTVAIPYPLSQSWIQYFLKRDPTYDTSNISYSDFDSLFSQGISEFDFVAGSNNPNLTAFRDLGGKLLSWHGLADNLVTSNSTTNYRQRVDTLMGGTEAVDSFYRLFFAPGVNHCGAGYGPVPVNELAQLVAWVENGTVPDTLAAQFVNMDGEVVNHDICKYPLVSKYVGGDSKLSGSYICANSF